MATQATTKGTQRVLFQEINCPGVYSTQTSEMFRIPPDGLVEGRSPLITWEAAEEKFVTRISDDPWTPISKARQLAASTNLPVNF